VNLITPTVTSTLGSGTLGTKSPLVGGLAILAIVIVALAGVFIYRVIRNGL
jgi:hypothetical protein